MKLKTSFFFGFFYLRPPSKSNLVQFNQKIKKSFSNFILNGPKNWVLSIFWCIENAGDKLQAKTFVVKKTRNLKSFLFCLHRVNTFCIFKKRSFDHKVSTFLCIQFFFCSSLHIFFSFCAPKEQFHRTHRQMACFFKFGIFPKKKKNSFFSH